MLLDKKKNHTANIRRKSASAIKLPFLRGPQRIHNIQPGGAGAGNESAEGGADFLAGPGFFGLSLELRFFHDGFLMGEKFMKVLKLAALFALAFAFSRCKAPTQTMEGTPTSTSVLDVNTILDTTGKVFIAYAQQTNGNPYQAIIETADWLQTLPNVASVVCDDSVYINIALKSGLTTVFYFEQVDANGKDVFRGAGKYIPRGQDERRNGTFDAEATPREDKIIEEDPMSPQGVPATHAITNKNVLVFASDTTSLELSGQLKSAAKLLSSSSLGLKLTTLVNKQCTYEAVSTFGSYGLVILDTHGQRDGFLIGSTLSIPVRPANESAMKALVSSQTSLDNYTQLTTGNISLGSSVKANLSDPQWQKKAIPDSLRTQWVTLKYLSTLAPLSGTAIFGNMCYSGNAFVNEGLQTPIRTAFLNLNPISYYCYVIGAPGSEISYSVDDDFARLMEDSLLTRLVIDQDSTGIANLKSDNTSEFSSDWKRSLFFRHFGSDNYSYGTCIDSFTDARDGQVYRAVCIGTQTWMAQNLNYNAPGSMLYNDDPANGPIYGRIYTWTAVMQGAAPSTANPSGVQGICPKGWHVPSPAEFSQLAAFLGGNAVAGGAMKTTNLWQSPNTGATNSSGFFAVPAGQSLGVSHPVVDVGLTSNFWDTFQSTANPAPDGSFWGGTYALTYNSANLDSGQYYQGAGYSCRCVKDP